MWQTLTLRQPDKLYALKIHSFNRRSYSLGKQVALRQWLIKLLEQTEIMSSPGIALWI